MTSWRVTFRPPPLNFVINPAMSSASVGGPGDDNFAATGVDSSLAQLCFREQCSSTQLASGVAKLQSLYAASLNHFVIFGAVPGSFGLLASGHMRFRTTGDLLF
jgi:hypothetical protein